MCDINTAFGSYPNLDLTFKFDIVVTYNDGKKNYMGVVTMNNASEGFRYRVFPGNLLDSQFLYQATNTAVVEGTVTGTNNNSFTFPIGSSLEDDFFVLIAPADSEKKFAVNDLPPGTVDLRDLSKSKIGRNWDTTFKETFAIFYPRRVLKARKAASKTVASFYKSSLKSESTRSSPPNNKVMTEDEIKQAVAKSKAMNVEMIKTDPPVWTSIQPFSDFIPLSSGFGESPVMPYDKWCECTPNFSGNPDSTSKQSPFHCEK